MARLFGLALARTADRNAAAPWCITDPRGRGRICLLAQSVEGLDVLELLLLPSLPLVMSHARANLSWRKKDMKKKLTKKITTRHLSSPSGPPQSRAPRHLQVEGDNGVLEDGEAREHDGQEEEIVQPCRVS